LFSYDNDVPHFVQAKGIVYKDPEKYAAEKSLATAIASAQKGDRNGKDKGNGFRSRGTRGRTGQNRNNSNNSKFGKKAQNAGRGSQKARGGKASNFRGKQSSKKANGNSDAKD
jgi:hypothetical protein